MTDLDFGMSAGRRRHQRVSPLWVVGAITISAFAALAASLPSVTPIYHLGEQVGGRLGGYVAEGIVGVPVGAAIAVLIWTQVRWSRFERLPKYLALAFVGWSIGMAAGTILTLDLDNDARNGPPPSGTAIEQAYWHARILDVNGYQQGFNTDLAALRRVNGPAGAARARQMRAVFNEAKSRNSGGQAQRQAQLEALGGNTLQRRALVVTFNDHVSRGEAMIDDLWERQGHRLDDIERAVASGRRGELISYSSDLGVWEATAALNGMLNRIRALPGAVQDPLQFETELVGGR